MTVSFSKPLSAKRDNELFLECSWKVISMNNSTTKKNFGNPLPNWQHRLVVLIFLLECSCSRPSLFYDVWSFFVQILVTMTNSKHKPDCLLQTWINSELFSSHMHLMCRAHSFHPKGFEFIFIWFCSLLLRKCIWIENASKRTNWSEQRGVVCLLRFTSSNENIWIRNWLG